LKPLADNGAPRKLTRKTPAIHRDGKFDVLDDREVKRRRARVQ
jgi:hypothetical protein